MSVIKKILKRLIFYFFLILSPLFFLIIKMISPLRIIRIIPVMTNRFGHLSLNLESYMVDKKDNKIDKIFFDIFITSRYGVCNYELLNLYKKNLFILPHYIAEPLYILMIRILKNEKNTIPYFSKKTRDLNLSWPNYKPSISLSLDQTKFCKKVLEDNGINLKKNRIVCLFNRDDTYLINQNKKKTSRKWDYVAHHKYNINRYAKVSEFLEKKNVYLFRMGKGAEENCYIKNKMFVDYANSNFRSDLMDIYLASKCMFGMGGGTGSKSLALVFRKPFLHLIADIHEAITYKHDALILTKHYFSKKLKRNLKLREILNYSYGSLSHLDQLINEKIEMRECSDDELVQATSEMYERVEGSWKDSPEIKKLQKIFKNHRWEKLTFRHNGSLVHPKINANFSSHFLLKNKNWLNGDD